MHFIIQRKQSLFLFLLISVNPVYSQCEMGILLKRGRSFYNSSIGHLHDDAILFAVAIWPVTGPGGRGALGYFLGGYGLPGTPNWHPVLKKNSPKIDTPF